jgi:hypothetical protein
MVLLIYLDDIDERFNVTLCNVENELTETCHMCEDFKDTLRVLKIATKDCIWLNFGCIWPCVGFKIVLEAHITLKNVN